MLTKRVQPFPTAAIGCFVLISGVLALLCHAWLETATTLSTKDLALIALLDLGPLGGSFFLWDAALKRGDSSQIGILSFLTRLLSTLVLQTMQREVPAGRWGWRH